MEVEISNITITLTSCGRFRLLENTIASLFNFWDGPKPKELLIYEDSELSNHTNEYYKGLVDYVNSLGWSVRVFGLDKPRLGQIYAVDTLMNEVSSEYVWHQEDDWQFFRTGFIEKSMKVLEYNPNIMQVWIRQPNDRNGHKAVGQIMKANGVRFQFMHCGFGAGTWRGFSFNPGLRRLSDYKRIFPNGYQEIADWDRKTPWKAESTIGQYYYKAGMKAATLLEGYVKHTGNGKHIY